MFLNRVLVRATVPSPACGADGHGHGSFYLFLNSSLLKPTADEFDHKSAGATELGRAWGDHAHVIFKDTYMDDHIASHGWGCMGSAERCGTCKGPPGSCANTSKCYCQNMTLAEIGSHGPGADPQKRVISHF